MDHCKWTIATQDDAATISPTMSISEKSELRQWLSRLSAADDCFLALVPANRAGAAAFSDGEQTIYDYRTSAVLTEHQCTVARHQIAVAYWRGTTKCP